MLVPVADLAAAGPEFGGRHGLSVVPGGRHPGAGTANLLVPLGRTYIELIAVVDEEEAAGVPRSRRVRDAVRAGRPFASWAVRTDDLAALRGRLASMGWQLPEPAPGSRRRPDGVLLSWTTQELVPPGVDSVLPFVIEWAVAPGEHPAEASIQHPGAAGDIAHLVFSAPDPTGAQARLSALLGEGTSFEVRFGPREDLVAIELEGEGSRLRIP